jgi:hypothetical protein
MFDGDACAGMFPALFSEDPEATAEALMANPVTAHKDLQRAAKTFFMPETLDLDEAFSMLKKPRYFKFSHINFILLSCLRKLVEYETLKAVQHCYIIHT